MSAAKQAAGAAAAVGTGFTIGKLVIFLIVGIITFFTVKLFVKNRHKIVAKVKKFGSEVKKEANNLRIEKNNNPKSQGAINAQSS